YDLWRRPSAEFKGNTGVLAYAWRKSRGDMPSSPPDDQARLWERVSQRALDVIRAGGDRALVMVPGYEFSAADEWDKQHPRPWIHDPAKNFRYEAHAYFDADHSGEYRQ